MAKVGDTYKVGEAAPEAGVYKCTFPGCPNSHTVTVRGSSLPAPHHPGSFWRLVEIRSTPQAAPAGSPASSSKPAQAGARGGAPQPAAPAASASPRPGAPATPPKP